MLDLDILRNYVFRMFLRKKAFVEFMERNASIVLPTSYSFKVILERSRAQIGDKKLLEILSLENEQEALSKIDRIPLFVNLGWENLRKLAGIIKAPIDERMNRGDLTRAILISCKLKRLMSVFENLASKDFIVRVDYDGRVIGPLGVTFLKPRQYIESSIALVRLFKGMNRHLLSKILDRVGLRQPSPAEATQMVLAEPGADKVLQIMTNMILSQVLKVTEIEEAIPFNIRADQRYGIHYISETAIEELSSLLSSEFSEQDLKLHLDPGYGSFNEKVLAYCIQNNPFDIIGTLMGEPQLRRCLVNRFGIEKSVQPRKKQELINLILFHMGFFIPTSPSGLNTYVNIINGLRRTLRQTKRPETIVGSVASAFVETEKILKDIIFFYGAHIAHDEYDSRQKRERDIENIEKEILKRCYGKEAHIRSIDKASFGQLIEILRLMEKNVKETPQLAHKLHGFFGRKTILDPKGRVIHTLDRISPYRKFYVHDVSKQDLPELKHAVFIIDLMNRLVNDLKGIYPTPIFGARIVTDNFGTSYLIAKDEQGREYRVYMSEYLSEEVLQHQYLMKSSESLIVINPLLVFKS